MSNKTIKLLASKLGLGDEEKVISKALELERLLQSKSTAGSNITDTGKIVICLDLAAGIFGVGLDCKTAIKYSGLKTLTYNNCRKTIENLLELNSEKLTIKCLCLMINCSGIQDLADDILRKYSEHAKVDIDLNLPQYVCMAVYQACRLNKVKVQKAKLIEKSRLKQSQWVKLDTEWSKFVDANFTAVTKTPSRKSVVIEKSATEQSQQQTVNLNQTEMETVRESYEDWKRRMLEEAYKELKEIELREQMDRVQIVSPRRSSPRKTPKKHTPYGESPRKGVRMLFS